MPCLLTSETAGKAGPLYPPSSVPKPPLSPTSAPQVGGVLGELVAAGGADLKVLAVHIRTADANPDEIQVGAHEPHAVQTRHRLA